MMAKIFGSPEKFILYLKGPERFVFCVLYINL